MTARTEMATATALASTAVGRRMVQAGARPMTSLQYLLKLQRDRARPETYEATTGIAGRAAGAYGLGLVYANAMFGGHEGH